MFANEAKKIIDLVKISTVTWAILKFHKIAKKRLLGAKTEDFYWVYGTALLENTKHFRSEKKFLDRVLYLLMRPEKFLPP